MNNNHIKLGLENFRIFSDYHEFDFAPFTILTGPNNSGKSTLHRALYMMASSFKKDDRGRLDIEKLSFNEISDKIGDFETNISYDSDKQKILVSFIFRSDLIDKMVDVTLVYKLLEVSKNGHLTEIIFHLVDNENKYLLFSLNATPHWHYHSFNISTMRLILNVLKEKGARQEMILKLCEKLMDEKYILTSEEKENIEELKNEGFILNPGDDLVNRNDAVDISEPNDWDVYDLANRRRHPYSHEYRKAFEYYSTPFEELTFNSAVLQKLDKMNYFNDSEQYLKTNNEDVEKLVSLLVKEGIYTTSREEFIEKYKDFENELIIAVLKRINSLISSAVAQIDGEIYFPFEVLNDMIERTIGEKTSSPWNVSINYFDNQSELINYIIENEEWSVQRLSDIRKNKKIGEGGLLSKSMNGSLYFLNLIWKEFISNLDTFISNTQLLLFDVSLKRHLLFDESTKFQSTLTKYAKRRFSGRKDEDNNKFIKRWLKEFHLGTSVEVEKIMAGKEVIGAEFFLKKKNRKVPLGDNGMGTNQLLLLILQIATSPHNSRFLLEEPEASLHPAFQSQLAEMFIDAHKTFGHTFVIETHSEYLIRKLQFLTAKKTVEPDDTRIYYFHHPDFVPKGEKMVKQLTIRPDGMLDGTFGKGFVDEADSIALELYRMQRNKIYNN